MMTPITIQKIPKAKAPSLAFLCSSGVVAGIFAGMGVFDGLTQRHIAARPSFYVHENLRDGALSVEV
jgi:hypothetical protein